MWKPLHWTRALGWPRRAGGAVNHAGYCGRIISGHARLEAARFLKLQYVPVRRIEHLTEAQIRAYIIADNKLAENAGWDLVSLAGELKFLTETDFDATLTGLEAAEIDILIQGANAGGAIRKSRINRKGIPLFQAKPEFGASNARAQFGLPPFPGG